jgi:hypothetical protein
VPHAVLPIGDARELLAGEEAALHELHPGLDPPFVLRRADPGGVGDQAAGLHVLQPFRFHRGASRSALSTTGLRLSGTRTRSIPPKNSHAASQPAITAAVVCQKVKNTKQCRDTTAVN